MPDDVSPSRKTDTAGHETALPQRWVIVRHTTVWHPPTDVYEQNDNLVVLVEVAGMQDSDFSVILQGQRLIISGVRRRAPAPDTAYHQLEIPYGEFRTEVELPWTVSREQVSASYRDGFLRVELPHARAQRVLVVDLGDE